MMHAEVAYAAVHASQRRGHAEMMHATLLIGMQWPDEKTVHAVHEMEHAWTKVHAAVYV
jgi:hypothetical protein